MISKLVRHFSATLPIIRNSFLFSSKASSLSPTDNLVPFDWWSYRDTSDPMRHRPRKCSNFCRWSRFNSLLSKPSLPPFWTRLPSRIIWSEMPSLNMSFWPRWGRSSIRISYTSATSEEGTILPSLPLSYSEISSKTQDGTQHTLLTRQKFHRVDWNRWSTIRLWCRSWLDSSSAMLLC